MPSPSKSNEPKFFGTVILPPSYAGAIIIEGHHNLVYLHDSLAIVVVEVWRGSSFYFSI